MAGESKIQKALFNGASALVDAAAKLRARCVVIIYAEGDYVSVHNGGEDQARQLVREFLRDDPAIEEKPFLGPRSGH